MLEYIIAECVQISRFCYFRNDHSSLHNNITQIYTVCIKTGVHLYIYLYMIFMLMFSKSGRLFLVTLWHADNIVLVELFIHIYLAFL